MPKQHQQFNQILLKCIRKTLVEVLIYANLWVSEVQSDQSVPNLGTLQGDPNCFAFIIPKEKLTYKCVLTCIP